jgi:hypothetical protein
VIINRPIKNNRMDKKKLHKKRKGNLIKISENAGRAPESGANLPTILRYFLVMLQQKTIIDVINSPEYFRNDSTLLEKKNWFNLNQINLNSNLTNLYYITFQYLKLKVHFLYIYSLMNSRNNYAINVK